MFRFRDRCGAVEFAITDARSDLRAVDSDPMLRQSLAEAFEVPDVAIMNQVHGAAVALADARVVPEADALIVDRPGIAALVRVADCVPVVLAAPDRPLAAVVHAGRLGMMLRVVPATVLAMRARGAATIRAWVGPHACARCYEVPEAMAAEVEAVVPGTRAMTSAGTASIDLGAGVLAQLREFDVDATELSGCTIGDDRFHSYRRQGSSAGRFGAVVAVREESR